MRKWKQKAAVALIVALAGLQVMPAAADETEGPKKTWVLKDDGWVYYDGDGEQVFDKIVYTGNGRGGKSYYYLDETGIMTSEDWVVVGDNPEDSKIYYAMPGGELAQFQWLYLNGHEMVPGNTGGEWYHFDDNRLMEAGVRKKISGEKYCFDDDGVMYSQGWAEFKGENTIDFGGEPSLNEEDGQIIGNWRYYEFDGQEANDKMLKLGEHWYQFDDAGFARIATASNASKLPGEVTSVSLQEDDTERTIPVGKTINIKFDVKLKASAASSSEASSSQASPAQLGGTGSSEKIELTEDHDFWHLASFDFEFANSFKLRRSWKPGGEMILSYTPNYPGTITLQAVVDGIESEEVTIISDWGEDKTSAVLNTMDSVFTSAADKENPTSINDTVNALTYLCGEMETDEETDKDALISKIESQNKTIQDLESCYVFANNIAQSNTVDEEAQELLSSENEPKIVGAVLNASAGDNVDFIVSKGDDVELPQSYEKEVSLDLSLEVDGSEVSDLTIPAQITVPIPVGMSTENLTLYHDHDGELEEVAITVSGNEATFMTDGFSNFIFAGAASDELSVPDSGNSGSGSSGGGGSSSGKSHNSVKGWVSQTKGIITGEGSSYSKWQPEQMADGSMKWKLIYADGTMAAGTIQTRADGTTYEQPVWEMVNGAWYPFGADGFVKDGWVQDELLGGIFYIDINRGMLTGWQLVDNKWYYFNPVSDGTMGILRVNTWIDGWYVGADGAWDWQPQAANQ